MRRFKFSPRAVAIAIALTSAGLAAYGSPPPLAPPVDSTSLRGYSIKSAEAVRTPTGTQFRGWVCRDPDAHSQAGVRLDRLNVTGAVIASATTSLPGLQGRSSRCTVFNLSTDWTLAPGERVLVCASRPDQACAPAP